MGKTFSPQRRKALIISMAALAALLILWQLVGLSIEERLEANLYARATAQISSWGTSLSLALNQRLAMLSGVEAHVRALILGHGDVDPEEMEIFAEGIHQSTAGIRNIAIAPGGVMQFVYPYEPNKSVLGYDPSKDERPNVRDDVRRAIESRQPVLSLPVWLIQGGYGVIGRQAVFVGDEYWGLVNVVVDLAPLLEDSGIAPMPADYILAIKDQSGTVFYGSQEVFDSKPVTYTILLPEGIWVLAGIPTGGWPAGYLSILWSYRILGLVVVAAVIIAIYLGFSRQEHLSYLVAQRTAELAQSNRALHAVMEGIEADVYVADLDTYEILYANKHMEKSFGTGLAGQICYKVFRNENAPCANCLIGKLLDEDGQPTGVHTWEGFNEVTKRWYTNADRAIPWHDRPYVHLQMATDITDLKQAEQALEAYSDSLEEIVAERTRELRETQNKLLRQEKLAVLGQLAGGVGHELRNPLGVITNAIYYLRSVNFNASAKTLEYLDIIAAEAQNANQIISGLLSFAKTSQPNKQNTSIQELVAQAISKHPAPEGITVKSELRDDLPEVFLDPVQMQMVLGNLIVNAYQAMPNGGSLTFRADSDGRMLYLEVIDTGIGIRKENLPKLFEPLFTTKPRGIGLGLAITKNLIEANGGRVEVESRVNDGATFRLYFPV